MTNRATWYQRLETCAPRVGYPLLNTLAAFLAAPASSDAVLLAADALTEAATAEALANRAARAADCRRLADLLREEAPNRKEIDLG